MAPNVDNRRKFVPALAFHWLTALYDPAVALLLRERTWKAAFVNQIAPRAGERIMDLGCGTGTLAILLKQTAPDSEIVGTDPDPTILARARRKAADAGLAIEFRQGFADEAGEPTPEEGRYRKIVLSLMLHHLDTAAKRRTLARALARLEPGGELHIADWGRPPNRLIRALFLPVQLLDGFATTRDNVLGRLPDFMQEEGFGDVAETRRWTTGLGSLSFYRARRPG